MLRKQKGITLIALVITIIVLLILAGITINLTIGQDGILKRAEQAGENYTNAADYENKQLSDLDDRVDDIIASTTAKTLVSQITGADYGKSINYTVTVNDTTLSNWKVLYNDSKNVYIILDGYLDNTLIPSSAKMSVTGKYQAYWEVANLTEPYGKNAADILNDTTIWAQFASGKEGATATGTPTYEMIAESWNENPNTNSKMIEAQTYTSLTTDITKMYVVSPSGVENCWGYWFASTQTNGESNIWKIDCYTFNPMMPSGSKSYGIRPVICLPSKTKGTVSAESVIMH